MKLTDAKLRTLKPKQSPYKKSDGRGLFILVKPNGSKLWRYRYRYEGKDKTLALGVYPDVTLAGARERLQDARSLLTDNIDPAEEKKTRKAIERQQQETFTNLAREWHEKTSGIWSKNQSKRVIHWLERDVFPYIGNMEPNGITTQDCQQVVRRVEDRGALDIADRIKNYVRKVFDYGIMTGKARVNPVTPLRGVVEKRPVQHRKALGREQLPDFLRKLEAAPNINAVTKAAAWLQVLTFLRPGEIRHGLWDEIKWQRREWHIPQTRTHPYTGEDMLGMKMQEPHVVPLSDQVLSILKDLKRLTGEHAFIFPGHHDYRKPLSEGAVLASIKKRLGYPVTAHGFRAVARTVLDEELGFRADYIEHQLHHAVRDPNGRAYNQTTYLKQRHEMMQTWADFIFNLKDSANVVAIRKAR